MKKTGCLLGATGLVGFELMKSLLQSPYLETLTTLTRRPIDFPPHPRWKPIVLSDFDQLTSPTATQIFGSEPAFDFAVTCLGTTLKQAGSRQAFRKIDFGYNLEFARLMSKIGVRRFLLLSAAGAAKDSFVFYSQVKGELEDAVTSLNFPELVVVQPALLVGDRKNKRPVEEFSIQTMRAFKKLTGTHFLKALATEVPDLVRCLESEAFRPEAQPLRIIKATQI